ncbi:hypothetical protein [Blastococcus sp. SYSU D00820]
MTEQEALPAALRTRPRAGAWKVELTRPDRRVMLFDVRLSEYREFFLVAVGDKSVAITSLDPSDETHLEPQCFVFAKPYGWDDDLDGDEALLQVWQAVGVQR